MVGHMVMTPEVKAINNASSMDDDLKKELDVPYNTKYKIAPDGLTYELPSSLRGCSKTKLKEDSPTWINSWASLDKYLAGEQEQIDGKAKADRELSQPHNEATERRLRGIRKFHSDNCSKQAKIREIFGPASPYHPNQLVHERHLPPLGLCDQETMYKLACKISDLQTLKAKHKLAMDPFDFLRWRVHLMLRKARCLDAGMNGKLVIKAIIRQLGETESPRTKHHDPVMRKAALWAAKYQSNLAKYGTNARNREKSTSRRPSMLHKTIHQSQSITTARAERRQRAEPSFYKGVNADRESRGLSLSRSGHKVGQ